MAKKIEEKRNSVYVQYSESSSGGEALSDERWSERADEIHEYEIVGAFRSSECDGGLYYEEVYVDFNVDEVEEVHVLVVRYSSGDTFGNSSGHGLIEGVYKDADLATKIGQAIEEGYNSDSRRNRRVKDYSDYYNLKNTPITERSNYFRWEGYFESLEGVEVHTCSLKRKPVNKDADNKINIKRYYH